MIYRHSAGGSAQNAQTHSGSAAPRQKPADSVPPALFDHRLQTNVDRRTDTSSEPHTRLRSQYFKSALQDMSSVEYEKPLYANNSQRCCLTFAMVSVTTGPGRSHYGDENSSKERLRIGSGNPLAQVLAMKAFI